MTANDKEIMFFLFGLIPLVIFARLFLVGAIAWFGTAIVYPFYLTRGLWIFIGYVLAHAWALSAKIAGVTAIVAGISWYFGYHQPGIWLGITLWYIFFEWPMFVLNSVIKVFS